MDIDPKVLSAVKRLSKRLGLPSPQREIGEGREAVVYDSTDPGVAVKITESMRPYEIIDMQGPGVIKVYHHEEIEVKDDRGRDVTFLIIWMEKLLATGYEIFEALGIPLNIGLQIERDLETAGGAPVPSISSYEAFRDLNFLLSQSGHLSDMGLRQVGLNSEGQVVVFDL